MFRTAMADARNQQVYIEHPNRDKPESKATKAVIVLLLLVSVGLVMVITIGGWNALEGAKFMQVVYAIIYLIIAYYVSRWNRGLLPVVAAAAIVLLIFAAVAAPAWFDRDKTGFTDPSLPSNVLGLFTLLIIPVQALLIFFAMRGFSQAWNVEIERRVEPGGSTPSPAAA
jgi:hypothetical protein